MSSGFSKLDLFREAARRGMQDQLPDDQKPMFDEAVRRGLVVLPETQQPLQQQAPEGFPGAAIIEPALTMVSGAIAEPMAGIAGLTAAAIPGLEPGAGKAVVEGVRERLTIDPKTQAGQESLRSIGAFLDPLSQAMQSVETKLGEAGFDVAGPLGGAVMQTLPTAIGEALGFFGGRALKSAANANTSQARRALVALDSAERGRLTGATIEDVASGLQFGSREDIARIIDADPEFYRAADELGLSTEPLASFASLNPQFRGIEQGLRAVFGSVLNAQAISFINDVSRKADDIIQKYGGAIDKAALGQDFKRRSLEQVEAMAETTNLFYDRLEQLIQPSSRYEAPNTVDFLRQKMSEDRLRPVFVRALNKLSPETRTISSRRVFNHVTGKSELRRVTEQINPTYGAIDQLRREVGQAINKKSGPFKDAETGLNKALYARLTKDLDNIADDVGGEAVIMRNAANSSVRQRKQIEDNLVTLLGKDLNTALNTTVSGAVKGLKKGEIDKFRNVVNAIPENQRAEVVISALNDVFRGSGEGQAAFSANQFTKFMQDINRSPAVRDALFESLPAGSRNAIDNLYTVADGVTRAQRDFVRTGAINTLFENKAGFVRKMMGTAGSAVGGAIIARTTGSPAAAAITQTTREFLKQSTNRSRATSELLGSPEFQQFIKEAVRTGTLESARRSRTFQRAERRLERSQRYANWLENLQPELAGVITSGGLINYLATDQEENR